MLCGIIYHTISLYSYHEMEHDPALSTNSSYRLHQWPFVLLAVEAIPIVTWLWMNMMSMFVFHDFILMMFHTFVRHVCNPIKSGWWFQIWWLLPIYGKIKNVPNHQPEMFDDYSMLTSLSFFVVFNNDHLLGTRENNPTPQSQNLRQRWNETIYIKTTFTGW